MQTLLLLTLLLPVQEREEIFSGPQKGEKTAGFTVYDVKTEKEHDYIKDWKGAPTLIVFIHELTRPGAQLFRQLDTFAYRKRDWGLKAVFVALSEDQDGMERRLPVVARAVKLKNIMAVSTDGLEGPGAYGLNKDVTLTIVIAKDNVVTANFALISPNGTDAPKIIQEIEKVLPEKPQEPKLDTPEEMRAEINRLRAEIRALRDEMEELRKLVRNPRPRRPKPNTPRPGKAPTDEELVSLLRALIQKTNSEEDVDGVIKDFEKRAGEDKDLRNQVIEAEKLIAHLKYGTDYARAEFKKLREKFEKGVMERKDYR